MAASWEDDGDVSPPNAAHEVTPYPVNRLNVEHPGEPVAWAEVARLGFAAAAAAGWLVVPSDTVNVILSGVAAVVSVVGTVLARRRVKPIR